MPSYGRDPTLKNRVWGFAPQSGRPNIDRDLTQENAMGSNPYSYENASGRAEWLSRDPLQDAELSQGANLYWYVFNNAVNGVDPSGLAEARSPAGIISVIVQTALDQLLDCPSLFKCSPTDCKICCQGKAAAAIALLGPVAGDLAVFCLAVVEIPFLFAACELAVLGAVALAIKTINDAEGQCETSCPTSS
jgi:hypothetical protein